MAQLNLYIDDAFIKKMERAAQREKVSLSKWVRLHLGMTLEAEWPPGFFELFGALKDSDLERPTHTGARDIPRKRL